MAEKIPPRFRKTKTDKWAVMAPIEDLEKALATEGGKIEVQRKSGDWSSFVVASLGRPFDVDGVQMCYGYGPEDESEGDGASGGSGGSNNAAGSSRQPQAGDRPPRRRASTPAPTPDPSEPMPEYQGGPEDEWQEF